jgi:hypothetical protein
MVTSGDEETLQSPCATFAPGFWARKGSPMMYWLELALIPIIGVVCYLLTRFAEGNNDHPQNRS